MALPYNGNIPQATDLLSVSQGEILTNFGSIQELIDVNHYDFDSDSYGKHVISTYPIQTPGNVSPLPTLMGEIAMYGGNGNTSKVPELWIQRQTGATPYVITESTYTAVSGSTNAGYSSLPSGVLINYGNKTISASTTTNLTSFAVGYSTAVYTMQVTVACATPVAICVSTLTLNNFIVTLSASTTGTVYWFAMGK
jgi:hypothetical protein